MVNGKIILIAVLVFSPFAMAQMISMIGTTQPATTTAPEGPKEFRITVYAAGEPRPALKYLLLPQPEEIEPGNAALIYFQAMQLLTDRGEAWDKIESSIDKPVKDLPRDLNKYALRLLKEGSRKRYCDWGVEIPKNKGMVEALMVSMPPLAPLRHLSKELIIKTRLEIADGNLDQAIQDLTTGYSLARHLGQDQSLISNLVGIAVASMLNQRVLELIQEQESPNLYWAIARLPHPLIDMRNAIAADKAWIYFGFPALRHPHRSEIDADQYRKIYGDLFRVTKLIIPYHDETNLAKFIEASRKQLPQARQYLIEQGYDKDKVEAMPEEQALTIYFLDQFESRRDDVDKWLALPYWQGKAGEKTAEAEVKKWIETNKESNPLASILSILYRALFLQVRMERQLCALQCIEAVRMYAHNHDGRLPAALEDIEEAPPPVDPLTGKPFMYAKEGNTFTLKCLVPEDPSSGAIYIVTVQPKPAETQPAAVR